MDTGEKFKAARTAAGLTQEQAAEQLNVSRQTISNWENNRSYPDILNVLAMSDIYSVSLDQLLKGDQDLVEHMQETMDEVKQTRKLLTAVIWNIFLLIGGFIVLHFANNGVALAVFFIMMVVSASVLLYRIIQKI
ncbi:MAG: helix-turn-helix transcriptional regulator [Eubacteriales bacterium]